MKQPLKTNILILLTSIFFLIVILVCYLDEIAYIRIFIIALVIFPYFIFLGLILIYEITLSIKEKFRFRRRLFLIGMISVVLFVTPKMLALSNKFQEPIGSDIIIARVEGAANCTTLIKFKDSGEFHKQVECFGLENTSGKFSIKNDTIWLDDDEYKFAVLKSSLLMIYPKDNYRQPFAMVVLQNNFAP